MSSSSSDKKTSSSSSSISSSEGDSPEKRGSPSSASSRSSASSTKGKRKLKASERRVSSKMAEKMSSSNGEDSEDEEALSPPPPPPPPSTSQSKRKPRRPPPKKASEDGEISEDSNKEFDDGLDDDLIGDEDDRNKLENMTEREREEELFKRAEARENLKKRFEIQKKLKQQQKQLKASEPSVDPPTAMNSDQDSEGIIEDEEEEEGQAPSEDEGSPKNIRDEQEGHNHGDEEEASRTYDHKERSHDRRKNLDALKYDKKSNALSELKAKRQEKEQKKRDAKEKEMTKESDSENTDWSSKKKLKASEIYSDDSSSSDSSPPSRRRSRSPDERSRSSRSNSSSSSSGSSAGDSDTERFHHKESKTQKFIDTQEELEPIRLSRHKLERFVHLPFFKKTVIGCFVRIGIGKHMGKPVYRCVEIVDVCETAKVYSIGRERTNCGLRLKFGKQERVFRLEFISNQSWTPTEFSKWKDTCQESNISLPTLEFVKNKHADIHKALKYEFTNDDVDKIVAQKTRFNRHPVNYAMNKARLMKEKEIAIGEGRDDEAQEIEKRLADLEERAEELDKKRTSTISTVSLINDRNRKDNVRKAEEAIKNEIRRKKLQGGDVANPFKRHKCNPRMVTKHKDPSTSLSSQDLLKLAENSKENGEPEKKTILDSTIITPGPPPSKKKKMEAKKEKTDLFDAHNFDIEIDVDTSLGPSNPVNVNLKPVSLAQKDTGPAKRSLNLDDYKKRRGLI